MQTVTTITPNTQRRKADLTRERLGALLDAHMSPREHLISPWLRQDESAMIFAPTGCGKSLFTLALCIAIAGGGEFLGWNCPKPRKVLFIDGEMPRRDIIDRARMILPTIDGLDMKAARENLVFLARQAQDIDADFPDLADLAGQESVLRGAKKDGFDLVVLDNFSTLAECEDENSASAFNGVIRFLMRMKQAGVGCLLIHHSGKGKNGDTYRGSSKLATTFEVIIGLGPAPDPLDRSALRFELRWEKFRGQRDAAMMDRTVTLKQTEQGSRWGHEVSECEQLREMVAILQTGEFRSQKALAKHLGVSEGELSKRKTRAIHDFGLISEAAWKGWLKGADEGAAVGFGTEDF